jgi:hypothetical protein
MLMCVGLMVRAPEFEPVFFVDERITVPKSCKLELNRQEARLPFSRIMYVTVPFETSLPF